MSKDKRTQQQRLHDQAKANVKPTPQPTRPDPGQREGLTLREFLFGKKR